MTTEAERRATQQMQDQTAYTRPDGRSNPGKGDGDAAMSPDGKQRAGTHVLPMPADEDSPAGMPREQRVHTEPGDPGNVAPEGQVAKHTENKTDS